MCKNKFLFYIKSIISSIEVLQEERDKNSLDQIYLKGQKEPLQRILNITNDRVFDIEE